MSKIEEAIQRRNERRKAQEEGKTIPTSNGNKHTGTPGNSVTGSSSGDGSGLSKIDAAILRRDARKGTDSTKKSPRYQQGVNIAGRLKTGQPDWLIRQQNKQYDEDPHLQEALLDVIPKYVQDQSKKYEAAERAYGAADTLARNADTELDRIVQQYGGTEQEDGSHVFPTQAGTDAYEAKLKEKWKYAEQRNTAFDIAGQVYDKIGGDGFARKSKVTEDYERAVKNYSDAIPLYQEEASTWSDDELENKYSSLGVSRDEELQSLTNQYLGYDKDQEALEWGYMGYDTMTERNKKKAHCKMNVQ